MANEIRITITDIGGELTSGESLNATFTVRHLGDGVDIATGVTIQGQATKNELRQRIIARARVLYEEYELRKPWFVQSLPYSFNVDA